MPEGEFIWVLVRLFVTVMMGLIVGVIVSNILKFYYPFYVEKRLKKLRFASRVSPKTGKPMKLLSEDVMLINPQDAQDNHISQGDLVCVSSPRGKIDIHADISEEVKPGVLSTTFHFPEVLVNILTSNVSDSEAMCPEYKVVAVDIRKARKTHQRNSGELVEN